MNPLIQFLIDHAAEITAAIIAAIVRRRDLKNVDGKISKAIQKHDKEA